MGLAQLQKSSMWEPHNAWRWDLYHYVGKDLWIPMILVLFAYCIAGGVHGEKYVNPLSDHWWSNPLNLRQHPSGPRAAMGKNIRHAAAGFCSFPIVVKSCRELLQKGSRKRRLKTQYSSYPIIECSEILRQLPLAQAGIDDRAPFFSRRDFLDGSETIQRLKTFMQLYLSDSLLRVL